MSTYIINNCPAILRMTKICDAYETTRDNPILCKERCDCVLKQIVEKCKKEIRVYRNTLLPNDGTNTLHFGRQSFAYDILQLIDIQEVE